MSKQRFPIGLTYTLKRKNSKQVRTIVDYLQTFNLNGDLVNIRYVTEHSFMGQTIRDYDVIEVSIARCLPENELSKFYE